MRCLCTGMDSDTVTWDAGFAGVPIVRDCYLAIKTSVSNMPLPPQTPFGDPTLFRAGDTLRCFAWDKCADVPKTCSVEVCLYLTLEEAVKDPYLVRGHWQDLGAYLRMKELSGEKQQIRN